ncbi:hypothetical protein Zmor_001929 [Zophobas morio]|uniref:Charged multivesicular body protein 7 n=2 Tax=Zophobas morio TaxID=2755281 RepID=A0AA38MTA2_9CUCU|nr:hypothetical protein Zmor_001929 [Zophobas morio]
MLNIPDDKLPQEFKDEARLDSLYSPFRSRTVNPRDWDTKISSWKHLISLYCVNNQVYSFSLVQLKKLFVRNGRPPSCFDTVLEELVKQGDLQYFEDFTKESPKTWSGWATNLLVTKPLSWSFNTVKKSLFSSHINPDRIYVNIGVVHSEAQKILTTIPGKHRNKVMNFSEFLKLIARNESQGEDVKLLLHYLIQEKKADLKNVQKDGDAESLLVKIGYQDKVITPISETDVSLYVLQQNEIVLTRHVEDLEDEVMYCIKEVKAHLLKGHRLLAKTCLKKKHEIQKRLTHKTNALHNVQVLLERIKDAQTDAEVWQSYKQALSAFNTNIKETGLSEDAIEDTMLKLGEILDIHEDIQTSISKPVIAEDEDLEEELEELMKTEDKSESGISSDLDEQLAKLDISDLPKVPSANVSVQEAL